MPTLVGSAASNVATVDANGQTLWLNSNASIYGDGYALTGLGQLQVIDSVGGGTVVLGGTDTNTGGNISNIYSGGTTILSGTLEVLNNFALPNVGVLTIGGGASSVQAAFNLNGRSRTTEGLVTLVSSVNPDLNFQIPGTDLITIGDLGMNIAANTVITFGTNPTVLGDYPLFGGNITGFNAADFVLPTAPAGDTYSLQVVSGGVDLVVAAVPEPGTLALLGAAC